MATVIEKHTPGPWTAEQAIKYPSFEAAKAKRNGVVQWQVRCAEPVMFGGTLLVEVVNGKEINKRGQEEREANAKLIAAAPDLAAMLTRAVQFFDDNGSDDAYTWLPELKGALVKAGLRKAPGKRWYVSEVRRPDAGGLWNATLVDGTECNRTPTHSQAGAQAIADELNAIEAGRA